MEKESSFKIEYSKMQEFIKDVEKEVKGFRDSINEGYKHLANLMKIREDLDAGKYEGDTESIKQARERLMAQINNLLKQIERERDSMREWERKLEKYKALDKKEAEFLFDSEPKGKA